MWGLGLGQPNTHQLWVTTQGSGGAQGFTLTGPQFFNEQVVPTATAYSTTVMLGGMNGSNLSTAYATSP